VLSRRLTYVPGERTEVDELGSDHQQRDLAVRNQHAGPDAAAPSTPRSPDVVRSISASRLYGGRTLTVMVLEAVGPNEIWPLSANCAVN
jgi:hypothetical protein